MGSHQGGVRLQVQSVLYRNNPEHVIRSLRSVKQASEHSIAQGLFVSVHVLFGDGSSTPVFDEKMAAVIQGENQDHFRVTYEFWGENYGTAKGHNILAGCDDADYIIVENPDILMAYDTIAMLFEPFRLSLSTIGMTEAKQLPIEHPKHYNMETGETSWCSTACTMIPRTVFEQVNGFDDRTFFLYCDDVDFSWRVRLKGHQLIYQPSAAVFHDKKLSDHAAWLPTSAEKYFSAEAGLLLTYKWSRADLTKRILSQFSRSNDPDYVRACTEFERRKQEHRLPEQLDEKHQVAEFIDNNYGIMRFRL